jgi:hypothetical protein
MVRQFVGAVRIPNSMDKGIDILSHPAIVSLYELLMGGTSAEK